MPLRLDINHLCLGFGDDSQGFYIYLLDNRIPTDPTFVGGVRYVRHATYLECKNMVSDGYGPVLLILLAQEARRLGLQGVTPDAKRNSAEAVNLVAKMSANPPPGINIVTAPMLKHADPQLNVLCRVTHEVVDEDRARRRFETHQGKGWRGWLFRWMHPVEGMAKMWLQPDDIRRFMKADYLGRSDDAFR
ncbi:hypothetical protein [Rhizobacter sp. P5_C2]